MFKHHDFTATWHGSLGNQMIVQCLDCCMSTIITNNRGGSPSQKELRGYLSIGRECEDLKYGMMKILTCDEYVMMRIHDS